MNDGTFGLLRIELLQLDNAKVVFFNPLPCVLGIYSKSEIILCIIGCNVVWHGNDCDVFACQDKTNIDRSL